ncbi:MAG TPA: alkaline phosphatase family protein [Candidatus Hydrogenedentes bacterium]|nr:alkaline phosphatase family protein [Candidatus Hydrogenedentota bacterium]
MERATLPGSAAITRRGFLRRGAAAVTAASLFHIGRSHGENAAGRVVILGFDGAEPALTRQLLEQGALPAMARLAEQGTAGVTRTTAPPQSPVAWTSFGTCKNPGGHNIFDFIRRDPAGAGGPLPLVGTGRLIPPEIAPDGSTRTPARGENFRRGTPFWSVADAQGLRIKLFNLPYVYPPDPLRHGKMMSGLGVPDLRGTNSTYFLLAENLARDVEVVSGGRRIRLALDGSGTGGVTLPGPRDPRKPFSDPAAYVPAPLDLRVDRSGRRGRVSHDGRTVELVEGQWSEWLPLTFRYSDRMAVSGITRFFPLSLGAPVRVYAACVQFHPGAPYTDLTAPPDFSRELASRYGLFKTIGWDLDTHALRQDDLPEDAFLEDSRQTMAWRERMTLDELDRDDWDVLVSVWTDTDRVAHMFWRFLDPRHPLYQEDAPAPWREALNDTLRRMDGIVGRVMERLRPGDTLIVMSDHGFGTWRTGFDVNAWLREQGWLAVSDPAKAAEGFLQGIDWSRTRAYALGLSSVYLNLAGRESQGIVSPSDADRVRAELKDRLLALRTPDGEALFRDIVSREVFHGEAMDAAPDLVLGYAAGYQNSKHCARGAVGQVLFEPNRDKWSGEHAASAATDLPGIFYCNRTLDQQAPHIRDYGVALLRHFGRDVPADYEGEAFLL